MRRMRHWPARERQVLRRVRRAGSRAWAISGVQASDGAVPRFPRSLSRDGDVARLRGTWRWRRPCR